MPTIPSDPSPRAHQPYRARRVAESFGTDPERYHRTRPRYPRALIDGIVASSPGADILDVGIGTGVSAEPFQAAGCRVVGIEVDSRMAEFARTRGFEVEVARFEDWDAAGRDYDAVIAGMTWHWVDPKIGAAKAASVLRDRGPLALFWNVHQPPPELADAFSAVYREVLPGTPFAAAQGDLISGYSRILDTSAAGIEASAAFTAPERLRFDWQHTYTTDEWLDQVPTFGGHSAFAPEKLDQLLSGIGAAIERAGGSFVMNYTTLALTATRADDERRTHA